MAYTKTTWANGDIITAEKLNNLENGVAGAYALIVPLEGGFDGYTLGKTWNEIKTAFTAGTPCFTYFAQAGDDVEAYQLTPILSVSKLDDDPVYYSVTDLNGLEFTTGDPDGYPEYTQGDNSET